MYDIDDPAEVRLYCYVSAMKCQVNSFHTEPKANNKRMLFHSMQMQLMCLIAVRSIVGYWIYRNNLNYLIVVGYR